ncbi:hypothetical protein ACFPRA_21920 [Sporosarcina soli]|uniref:Histidine kinase/HSP90-like ATPase domain-containing protein n=1 Tax=Sporosarcina soli TaxID=334736 RepID=A0ABW0TQT5_9BACL
MILIPEKLDNIFVIDNMNSELFGEMHSINENIVVDLSSTSFTYPFGMVSLLVGLENLNKLKPVIIDFNKTPNALLSYIERMNFFNFLPDEILNGYDLNYLRNRKRNNLSEVLLEITPITQTEDVYNLTDCIYKIFSNKVSSRVTNNIMNIVTELANNILDHSESTGYVAIQFYKKSNTIRMAIIDDGIGIINKFKTEVTHIHEPLRILKKAFKLGNSTRENIPGGKGLKNMWANSYDPIFSDTTIFLKTGENIYKIKEDNIVLEKKTSKYKGTFYDFTIKIA